MDLIDQVTPALQLGERVVVRHRLPDSSATDVIGIVAALEPGMLTLRQRSGVEAVIERTQILAAKRVPLASRGRDPLRESAERIQRLSVAGWVDHADPLGEWLLRFGGGFTGRANSCLAIGDPGLDLAAAAQAIVAFAETHQIKPLAQVIEGSAEHEALAGLGWQPHSPTSVLVLRLVDLLGDAAAESAVQIESSASEAWLDAYDQSRPNQIERTIVRRILTGNGPAAFAAIWRDEEIVAIGKGHVADNWLGVAALWTRPDSRRQGFMSTILRALGLWGAELGARSVYLQVEADNGTAQHAYAGLGFTQHHRYLYLAPRPN